jgi:hypothetical protein
MEIQMVFSLNTKLVPTLLLSTLAILSFAGRVLALSTCPNKSEQSTINLGVVTTNPFSACVGGGPTGEECTNLSFSGLGAFSMQHTFSFSVNCSMVTDLVTFTGTYAAAVSVLPKYQVVSVYYAPPGAKSNATYGSSYMASTNSAFSNTFSVANQVSLGVSEIAAKGNSASVAVGWSESSTTSDSIAISTTTSENLQIPGPSSSRNGIDHTQDLIAVWLNPGLTANVVPGASVPIQVTAVTFDNSDPDQGMDVYPLSVANLQVLAAGGSPTGVDMTRLARSWSPTGALTPADYQSILAADPFATNANFNPSTDPSARFDSLVQTINYTPAGSGGQPIITGYNSSYSTTSTAGQSATDMHSVTVAVSSSIPLGTSTLEADLKAQTTWTWTNMWSTMQTSTTGQTANFQIASPLPTDGYTGPSAIGIYKDNVYGTFMFFGEL